MPAGLLGMAASSSGCTIAEEGPACSKKASAYADDAPGGATASAADLKDCLFIDKVSSHQYLTNIITQEVQQLPDGPQWELVFKEDGTYGIVCSVFLA